MTEIEYYRHQSERYALCSLTTGYLWGVLQSLVLSEQISDNVRKEIARHLEEVRPWITRIYELGALELAKEADDQPD